MTYEEFIRKYKGARSQTSNEIIFHFGGWLRAFDEPENVINSLREEVSAIRDGLNTYLDQLSADLDRVKFTSTGSKEV